MEERILTLAQEAVDLHTDPRSHMKFRLSLTDAVTQVVDEQDTLDVDTIGKVVAYRNSLISEVSAAAEQLQAETSEA